MLPISLTVCLKNIQRMIPRKEFPKKLQNSFYQNDPYSYYSKVTYENGQKRFYNFVQKNPNKRVGNENAIRANHYVFKIKKIVTKKTHTRRPLNYLT